MRITRVTLTSVVVPARAGSINSPDRDRPLHKLPNGLEAAWTVQFDALPKVMLVAECDDGTVGFGESLRGADESTLAAMCRVLIGMNVATLRWGRLPFPQIREYEAVETLALDLLGKCWGVPATQVLGGRVRDRVAVGAWSGHRNPADAGRLAAEVDAAGFRCLKFKCDLDDDVPGIAAAVQEATGNRMRIIFDPNERFDELRHALAIARALERIGNVLCLEDPLPRWDLDAYAELRRRTDIPVAVHVALGYAQLGQRAEDVDLAFRAGAADMYNLSAGVGAFLRMAHVADAIHRPYWHGSEIDLGVMEAAMTHAAAAVDGCTLPSDIFGRSIREHDLLVEGLHVDGGTVAVPDGPGLGVTIDAEALDHYALSRTVVE